MWGGIYQSPTPPYVFTPIEGSFSRNVVKLNILNWYWLVLREFSRSLNTFPCQCLFMLCPISQEIKHLQQAYDEIKTAAVVDIQCQLADRSHDLLLGK